DWSASPWVCQTQAQARQRHPLSSKYTRDLQPQPLEMLAFFQNQGPGFSVLGPGFSLSADRMGPRLSARVRGFLSQKPGPYGSGVFRAGGLAWWPYWSRRATTSRG